MIDVATRIAEAGPHVSSQRCAARSMGSKGRFSGFPTCATYRAGRLSLP